SSLSVPWISANRANKARITKEIDKMPLANQVTGGGTRWLPPLQMAVRMQQRPDLIYLLTDGDAHDRDAFLSQLGTLVPANVPIHPISLELPGTVSKVLIEVAEKTGGSFSLVYNGKLYTGKR